MSLYTTGEPDISHPAMCEFFKLWRTEQNSLLWNTEGGSSNADINTNPIK